MAAYLIADIDVTDPAGFEEYRSLVAPQVAQFGGKYLVRGGAVETAEGDWASKRIVILEFETKEQLQRWWESEEYKPVKAIRHRSATTNALIVEGV